MARSLNQVTLLGRLGADPESKSITGGSTLASASLATSQSWKDKEGTWQEKTQWHRLVAWATPKYKWTVDALMKAKKGDNVLVTGEIEYRKWDDKEGVTRHITEIKITTVIVLGRGEKKSSDDAAAPDERRDDDDLPY
mgnify:CR=1 FL=1